LHLKKKNASPFLFPPSPSPSLLLLVITHLCDHTLCSRGQVVRGAAGPGRCPRRGSVRRRRTHRRVDWFSIGASLFRSPLSFFSVHAIRSPLGCALSMAAGRRGSSEPSDRRNKKKESVFVKGQGREGARSEGGNWERGEERAQECVFFPSAFFSFTPSLPSLFTASSPHRKTRAGPSS